MTPPFPIGLCRDPVNLNITSRGCHFMTFCDFRKKSRKKKEKPCADPHQGFKY
jgi:hypothetical protein